MTRATVTFYTLVNQLIFQYDVANQKCCLLQGDVLVFGGVCWRSRGFRPRFSESFPFQLCHFWKIFIQVLYSRGKISLIYYQRWACLENAVMAGLDLRQTTYDLTLYVTVIDNVHTPKRVFIWRRASPLGGASPSKKAGFHLTFTWEFSRLSSTAGSRTRAYINFFLWVPHFLSGFTWKIFSLPWRDLRSSIARSRLGGLAPFSRKQKQISQGISQRRGLNKKGQPTGRAGLLSYKHYLRIISFVRTSDHGALALCDRLRFKRVCLRTDYHPSRITRAGVLS